MYTTSRCLLTFTRSFTFDLFFSPSSDPCLIVMPPCMGDADRFSLEALRHIHKQLDDDNDGGIEVNESVEVSALELMFTVSDVRVQ